MKIHILIPLLAIAILFGCSKEPSETPHSSEKKGTMTISTRAAETSTDNFEDESTFRLVAYDAGTTNPYLAEDFGDIYSDILATKTDGVWGYSFDGGESSGSSFGYIVDVESPKSIDFIAASPYIEYEDLSAVPFTVSTLRGYMWAKTESILLDNTSMTTSLSFSHIVSALHFTITLKNNVTGVDLKAIIIELLDSEGNVRDDVIVSSGTIDFNNGTINPSGGYSGSYVISSSDYFVEITPDDGSGNYSQLEKSIYLPPFEMAETDKLRIGFKFDNVEIAESITLSGADLAASDGTFGLERGYRYNLNIELDNYLKFSGEITKDTNWIDADDIIQTDI